MKSMVRVNCFCKRVTEEKTDRLPEDKPQNREQERDVCRVHAKVKGKGHGCEKPETAGGFYGVVLQ